MYRNRKGKAPGVFAAVAPILILFVATAILVRADPNPSGPGPGDVFIEGQPCTISWDIDRTGAWKTMNIELMTGDNFDMVSLAPIATVDGTNSNKNTYSYTCPRVDPHSPIYFYQFSTPSSSNKTWTGRFMITDGSGKAVAPSNSIQKDGTKIPWGIGSLVGGIPVQLAGAGGGGGTSVGSVVSANASSASGSTSPSSSPNSTVTPSRVSPATSSASLPTESVVPNTDANGVVDRSASSILNTLVFQTGLALGFAVVGFTLMC